MKKYIIILFSMLLLIGGLTNAQTIKRSKQKTEQDKQTSSNTPKDPWPKTEATKKQSKTKGKKKNHNDKPTNYYITPQRMRSNYYYICVLTSWNVENARALCRSLKKQGYNVQMMYGWYNWQLDGQECYTICVKQTTRLQEAKAFARSFKNPTEYADCVYYGSEYIGSCSDFLDSNTRRSKPRDD